MKKFLKSIFITLSLSLVIICAGVFLQVNNVNSAYALDNDTMHTVNFYSENNLLYSIEVPDGYSLDDLQNANLLKNNFFSEYNETLGSSYTGTGYYFDYWRGTRAETTVSYDNGCLVVSGGNASSGIIQLLTDYDNLNTFAGKTFYASIKINSIDGTTAIRVRNSTNWLSYANKNISSPGIYTITGVFPNDFNYTPVIYLSADLPFNEFSVEWCNFILSDNYLEYFNVDYLNQLFRNFNNLSLNDNILWSTINNSGQFDFDTPITSDINLYGYEEFEFNNNANQLEAEITYQPSYYLLEKAINNIEYIHYKGQFKFNVSIDTSKLSDNVQFLTFRSIKAIGNLTPSTSSTTTQTQYFSSMSFSNEGFDDFEYLNFALLSQNNSIYVELKTVNLIPTYTFYLVKNTGTINFIFSPSSIALNVVDLDTGTTKDIAYFGEVENYIFYDGTYINDMNSNTNYFLNFDYLTLSSNYYLDFSKLIEKQLTTISITYNYNDYNNSNKYLRMSLKYNNNYNYYDFYQQDLYIFTGSDQFSLIFNGDNSDGITFLTNAIPDNAYTPLTAESGFYFSQFDIIVRKPVARVDNSLVIFNFGYNNFLNAVTQVKYELRRGINYYDVVYNGQLENSKMIVIDNEFVRNSLFDEYIFVSFVIGGNNSTTYDVVDGKIGTYLGFDFNFVYYTQPLIAGNSAYDLMEYRPQYMDATPSLVPFVLPVTAWIYNAFLWLVFDCPLISDLLELIHLNRFLGALMSILNIYISSAIGQFILACLSFVIFWAILKSLMPALVGSGKAIYGNTQFAYNRRQKKQDKLNFKNAKKEMKYQGKIRTIKRNEKFNSKLNKTSAKILSNEIKRNTKKYKFPKK